MGISQMAPKNDNLFLEKEKIPRGARKKESTRQRLRRFCDISSQSTWEET